MTISVELSHPELTALIVSFLTRIGLECRRETLGRPTFLPGLDISEGIIFYDPERLLYPGDMLHEAGHLCVLLPADRTQAQSPDQLYGDLGPGGAEMGAIAWSWATLKHLGLPPEIVFHGQGYAGGSEAIIDGFNTRRYFGVSLLQWMGMTTEPGRAQPAGGPVYPAMHQWLRQEPVPAGRLQ